MLISDEIAKLIEEMLGESEGYIELKRNDLASRMGCVPSQINYVITSRFTPEKGYLTESRRGGGGYIRIRKIAVHKENYLMHFIQALGESVDKVTAAVLVRNLRDNGFLSNKAYLIVADLIQRIESDEQRAIGLRRLALELIND